MSCKKILSKPLVCGVALSVLALAPLTAKADTMMMSDSTTTTSMSSDAMMAPTMVTGTVLRYYSDRAGFVSSMDVQTADGVKMVRFSPGMAQRLLVAAPVGGTVTAYVTGTTMPELVSVGDKMPSPNMKMMSTPSDLDILNSTPYTQLGAKQMKVSGRLKGVVTNEMGDVVALVIRDDKKAMMMKSDMSGSTMSSDAMMSDNMMSSDKMMMAGTTLVRVPRELRSLAPGFAGTERVTPLFKGADVEVTGLPEAPRYGSTSIFENRIIAGAIVVNGRAAGPLSFQRLMTSKKERMRGMTGLMNSMGTMDMSNSSMSAEQMNAANMGYMTYGTMGGEMSSTTTTTTTTTTDSTTTTSNR